MLQRDRPDPSRSKALCAVLTASGAGSGTRRHHSPVPGPEGPFCTVSGLFCIGATIPDVTLAIPLLLFLIGLALIAGRRSPPILIAVVFLIIGFYMGNTDMGKEIVTGLNSLARIIE